MLFANTLNSIFRDNKMTSIALQNMSNRLEISVDEVQKIIMKTVMPSGKPISNEMFNSFIAVANEYKLNPLTKEIYAYPTSGGGIQPIVSIDGWLRIINSQPDFNGMTYVDNRDANSKLISVTCRIFKKGIEHPIEVTEYLDECKQNTIPWNKYPSRMLRHKATIQAGRYAFGLSGIIDPDEAERYEDAGVIDMGASTPTEKDITPTDQESEVVIDLFYTQEDFDKNFPSWKAVIESGKNNPTRLISIIEAKAPLTDDQKIELNKIKKAA